jgi:hypothetical protein
MKLILHNDEGGFNKTAHKGGKTVYFAQSEKGETWVPLVEKAFAKLHSDYASLCRGITGEGIVDMTGSVILLNLITLHHPIYWNTTTV